MNAKMLRIARAAARLTIVTTIFGLMAACSSGSSSPSPPPPPPPPVVVIDADGDGVEDAGDNCVNEVNPNQEDRDADGAGDACDPLPLQYVFTDGAGADTVSYTGQTKRQILIADMVDTINSLVEDPTRDVEADLNFFFRYDSAASDTLVSSFDADGEPLLPNDGTGNMTYGSISSGKDLVGKIAGGDGAGGGETSRLIGGEFFGWGGGDADPLPVEFVDYLFAQLNAEATNNVTPQIPTAVGDVALDTVTVDAMGIDYRQMIQKFLLSAVNLSQALNDYFQTDFAGMLVLADGKAYTEAEHDWDESFGYFGAARNYNDYTDEEIKGAGGRPEFANGYNDANGDGLIDIRSEFNFGASTNCAKRDLGSAGRTNPTDFTKTAFDAYLLGREVLKNAAAAGELSADAQAVLDTQIQTASHAFEMCIAATVVHYINDTLGDMASFDTVNGTFADLANFKNLAKHWAEMKGFAFAMQFSPASPFRDNETATDNLRQVYTLMGDYPVLADGTQGGVAFAGGVAQYESDLLAARDIIEATYGFDNENVINW